MFRLLIAAVLLTLTASASAQTTPANPYEDKTWALLFGLEGDFFGRDLLTSFSGARASARYQLSSHSAVRGSVGFSAYTSDSDRGDQTEMSNSTTQIDADDSARSQSTSSQTNDLRNESSGGTTSLSIEYLRHFPTGRPITFFLAGGPTVGLTDLSTVLVTFTESESVSQNETFTRTETSTRTDANDQFGWNAGVLGSVGAEWFVASHISLTAEYTMSAGYGRTRFDRVFQTDAERTDVRDSGITRTQTDISTEERSDDGSTSSWTLSAPSARFGVSLYF